MTQESLWVESLELDTRWMADAACVRIPGLPWTDNLSRVPKFVIEHMAEVCRRCPVRQRCDAFTAEAEITAGYWAGSSRNSHTVRDFTRIEPRGDEAA